MADDMYRNRSLFDTRNEMFLSSLSSPGQQTHYHRHEHIFNDDSFAQQQKMSDLTNRLIPVHVDINTRKTMEEHSTIYYHLPELVLRRGQGFSCILVFNQAFRTEKYRLILVFKSRTWKNVPVIKIPLNDSSNDWSVKIIPDETQRNNHLHLQIFSSPDALIGKYSLFLEIRSVDSEEPSIFQFESDFYLICNPWNKDDSCGSLSNDQIGEYVLNEHGEIYLGSAHIPQFIPWYFGQFESPVLPTALTLFNRVQLPTKQRIDTSTILRILVAKICSDPGTINGIFPSILNIQPLSCVDNAYTSSPAILKQFIASNGQSLTGDSGTNWQHAAVFCSLCRSLGIPCRVVTIYNAILDAKDNSNRTCPWYLWNECWFHRDDLPKDKTGWQVLDSSSNQSDTKARRLGPCSVPALKAGSFDLKWDTPAIHSLLNGNQTSINSVDEVIKRKILTKSLNNKQGFDDLTCDYITTEPSNLVTSDQDVQLEIQIPDRLKSSESLTAILTANNRADVPRTLSVALSLSRINPIEQPKQTYWYGLNTGHQTIHTPIRSSTQTLCLDPNQSKTFPLKIADNRQVSTGCFDSSLRLNVQAKVKETGQIYRREKYILNDEDITLKLFFDDDVISIGQSATLNIQISNSPSHSWNHGHITVDGFGLLESLSIRKDPSSNNSITVPFKIFPTRIGIGRLYVTFATGSLCLSPKSILLEVIGLPEMKIVAGDHLQPQSLPSEEKLQKTQTQPQPSSDDSIIDRPLNTESASENKSTHQQQEPSAVTSNISTSEQNCVPAEKDVDTYKLENTNIISAEQPLATSPADVQVPNIEHITLSNDTNKPSSTDDALSVVTKEEIRQYQTDQIPSTVPPLQSTVEDFEKSPLSEQKTEVLSTTTEQTTKQDDATPATTAPLQSHKDKETLSEPALANESPLESIQKFTTEDTIDKREETISESKTETVEPMESIESKVESTPSKEQEKSTIDNDGTNEKIESQSTACPELVATSFVQTTTDETKANDEEPKLLQSSDITEVDNKEKDEKKPSDKVLSIDASSPVTTTETSNIEDEKEKPLNTSLPENETTVEEKKEDKSAEVPSPEDTIQTGVESTTTEPVKDDREKLLSFPSSLDNLVSIVAESITSEKPKSPLLNTSIEPFITTEEKKQGESTEVPSSESTTTEPVKEDQEKRLSFPSSLNNLVSIVAESITSEKPKSPVLNTSIEPFITTEEKKQGESTEVPSSESTTTEPVKEDKEKLLSFPSSLNNLVSIVAESITLEKPKSPVLNTSIEPFITTEQKKEDDQSRQSEIPVAETAIVEDAEKDDIIKSKQIPSLVSTTEIITEIAPSTQKREDEETKLSNISPVDNITQAVPETSSSEEIQDTGNILSEPSSSNLTSETIPEMQEDRNRLEQKPSLDITPETKAVEISPSPIPSINTTIDDTTKLSAPDESRTDEDQPLMTNADKTIDIPKQLEQNDERKSAEIVSEAASVQELPENKTTEAPQHFPAADPSRETTIDQAQDNDDRKRLEQNSPSNINAETTISKVEETGSQSPQISAPDTVSKIETVTTTVVEEKKDDEESKSPQILSSDSTFQAIPDQKVEEDKINSDQPISEKPSSSIAITETIAEVKTPEKANETVGGQQKPEDQNDNLSDVSPSKEIPLETFQVNVPTEDQQKNSVVTDSTALSPHDTAEPVVEILATDKTSADNEQDLPKISTSDIQVATNIVAPVGEEKTDAVDNKQSEIEPLSNRIETVVTTTTIEQDKKEPVPVEIVTIDKTIEDNEKDRVYIPTSTEQTATISSIAVVEERREDEQNRLQGPSSPGYYPGTTARIITTEKEEEVIESSTLKSSSPFDATSLSNISSTDATVETINTVPIVREETNVEEIKTSEIAPATVTIEDKEKDILPVLTTNINDTTVDNEYISVQTSVSNSTMTTTTEEPITEPVETDKEEEVSETTLQTSPSLVHTSESVIIDDQYEDDKTSASKISSTDTTVETTDTVPIVQEESETSETSSSSDFREEIVTQIVTAEQDSDDEAESLMNRASPIIDKTETLLETVPVESPTSIDEDNSTSSSDITSELTTERPSQEEVKEDSFEETPFVTRPGQTIIRRVTHEFEDSDSEAPWLDNMTDLGSRTDVFDSENEDHQTDLPQFPHPSITKSMPSISAFRYNELMMPESRCFSVETIIDTVPVGDRMEEVEVITLKHRYHSDSSDSLHEATTDTDDDISDNEKRRRHGRGMKASANEEDKLSECTSPSYRTKTVTQTVKVGDQEEDVDTIVLKTSSSDDVIEKFDDKDSKDKGKNVPFISSSGNIRKDAIPGTMTVSTLVTKPTSQISRNQAFAESLAMGDLSNRSSLDTSMPTINESGEESVTKSSSSIGPGERLVGTKITAVGDADAEASLSEASSQDNITELVSRPNFANKALNKQFGSLTPASRCYSVETIIDTVNVGDKTEEVELIMLKPQFFYDSSGSLNEVTTDTDNETSENEKTRDNYRDLPGPADDENKLLETTSPNYRTKTVIQTVKVGDQEEEVETIVLKAPSLDDVTEKTIDEDTTDQVTNAPSTTSLEAETKTNNTIPRDEEESDLEEFKSSETVPTTQTNEQRNDDTDTVVTKSASPIDKTATVVESVATENKTPADEKDLSNIPSSDTTVPTVEQTGDDNVTKSSSSSLDAGEKIVEHTDAEASVSAAPSLDNITDMGSKTDVFDSETEDRQTDLPQFPHSTTTKTLSNISALKQNQSLTPASRCYSVETIIDTINVGDKTEEVELIMLKPKFFYDSIGSLNEATADTNNETAENEKARDDEDKLSDIASPSLLTKTVTQTVKVGDQEEEVETIVLKAPSLNDVTEKFIDKDTTDQVTNTPNVSFLEEETITSTAVPIAEQEKEGEKTESPESISLDGSSVDGTVETDTTKDNELENKSSPSQALSSEDTKETITETSNLPPSNTNDEESTLEKAPFTDNKGETVSQGVTIEENKKDDEETTLPKVSSVDQIEPITVETTVIEQETSGDQNQPTSSQQPAKTIEKTTDLTTTEENKDLQELALPKMPSLDTARDAAEEIPDQAKSPITSSVEITTDSITEIEAPAEDKESNDRQLFKTPSLGDVIETVTVTRTIEDQEPTDRMAFAETPSISHITKIVADANENQKKNEDEERAVPEAPSFHTSIDTIPEVTTNEDTKDVGQTRIIKVPFLEIKIPKNSSLDTTTVTVPTNKDENDLMTLSGSPYLGNITNIVAQATGNQQNDENKQTTPPRSPSDHTTDERKQSGDYTTSGVPSLDNTADTGDNSKETSPRKLSKVPSLEDMTGLITKTTTIEEKKPEETKLFKVPSLELLNETASKNENIEDVKDQNEANLLANPSLQTSTETPSQISPVETETDNNKRQLSKVPSLEDVRETVIVTTTTENGKKEDEQKLSQIPSIDFDTGISTKPSIIAGEQKKEELPALKNIAETTTQRDAVINESEQLLRSDSSSTETSSTDETAVGPPTIHIPIPEHILLDSSFRLVPRKIRIKKPAVSFKKVNRELSKSEPNSPTETTAGSGSFLDTELAKTKERKTDEEVDSSAEDLRGWLNNLVQHLTGLNETETDGEANILRSSTEIEDATKEVSIPEKSTSEKVNSWLDDRLQQMSTIEEPTEANVLVKTTTVITETTTTTTTEDDDFPTSTDDSVETVKYLVQRTTTSDNTDLDDESSTVNYNDQPAAEVTAELPLSTSNINTRDTTQETVLVPEEETVIDRVYFNMPKESNFTISDGSHRAIIADNEKRNSPNADDVETMTNSTSTMKDAESLSDTMATDMDHELNNEDVYSLACYADFLSEEILESAVISSIYELHDISLGSSPTTSTVSEQFTITESTITIDDRKRNTNSSSNVIQSAAETDEFNGQ